MERPDYPTMGQEETPDARLLFLRCLSCGHRQVCEDRVYEKSCPCCGSAVVLEKYFEIFVLDDDGFDDFVAAEDEAP